MRDILEDLRPYLREKDPRKAPKLASTFDYRCLQLRILREVLVELRKISELLQEGHRS